jgi:hypothetical protein
MNSANPLVPGGGFKEWSTNELILKDPALRARAGVKALDEDVSEVYRQFPSIQADGAPVPVMKGGANNAPFGYQNFGSATAAPYAAGQAGGAYFPLRYYEPSRWWN